MPLSRSIMVLVAAASVAGCAMFENSPAPQTREDRYFETEYVAASSVTMPVQSDGQTYEFKVWLSRKHPRVLVQATQATADATRSAVSRYSLGMVERPLEDAPYRDAALKGLANSGKSNCSLKMGGQVAANRFEWTYECAR